MGPSSCLTYLGFEIDTTEMEVRLPIDKLSALKKDLLKWVDKTLCTKRELLSLIGKLSFASKVVKPGRIFLRRLIDKTTTITSLNGQLKLDTETKADIQWWGTFIQEWNGLSIIQEQFVTS